MPSFLEAMALTGPEAERPDSAPQGWQPSARGRWRRLRLAGEGAGAAAAAESPSIAGNIGAADRRAAVARQGGFDDGRRSFFTVARVFSQRARAHDGQTNRHADRE